MSRLWAVWGAVAVLLSVSSGHAAQDDERLDGLFERLRSTATVEAARPVEAEIWRIWTHAGLERIDSLMNLGIAAMSAGRHAQALQIFDHVVSLAPDFAEGWNKRATVHYLVGDFEASVTDIQRTLTLEPRHFGALSGLGLIYVALGEESEALKAFEKALQIHPHLPAAKAFVPKLRLSVEGRAI